MEDAAYFPCHHRPYYLPFRNPYLQYFDQHYYTPQQRPESVSEGEIKHVSKYLKLIKIMAYIQVFVGGVLLITDISKVVLLWNFVDFQGTKLEMLSQISFPLFILTLGFVTLAATLAPSQSFFKLLAVVLVSASIPNFVQPKQAIFLTTALEAVEVSRATEKSAWKGSPESAAGMIRSEAHNRLARILAVSVGPGRPATLGVQDLSSLPSDILLMMQYLLVSYSLFSFFQLVLYGFTLFFIVQLLSTDK